MPCLGSRLICFVALLGGSSVTVAACGGSRDPTLAGPYAIASLDAAATSTINGATLAVHVAYPTHGPTRGPYPVVLFAHGFLIPPSEYVSYLERAASFGYVALSVDYPTLDDPNFVANTTDLLTGLDWLAAQSAPPLGGLADLARVGSAGHSLGGKLAILAAARDSRIKAVITFDAVDGAMFCSTPANCPDAHAALPLPIPTAFLGETLDNSGGVFACAPAAYNYAFIYGAAASPSLAITVLGAGHTSFVDSLAACGSVCELCQSPDVPQSQTLNIAHAYLVAFFERYLRGNKDYDSDLVGDGARTRFVSTHQIQLQSK